MYIFPPLATRLFDDRFSNSSVRLYSIQATKMKLVVSAAATLDAATVDSKGDTFMREFGPDHGIIHLKKNQNTHGGISVGKATPPGFLSSPPVGLQNHLNSGRRTRSDNVSYLSLATPTQMHPSQTIAHPL